jgi:hypothetical protein
MKRSSIGVEIVKEYFDIVKVETEDKEYLIL